LCGKWHAARAAKLQARPGRWGCLALVVWRCEQPRAAALQRPPFVWEAKRYQCAMVVALCGAAAPLGWSFRVQGPG
jgi:hypothetical protein